MPGCSIGLLFQGWSREVPLRLRLYHMPSRELPPLARGLPSPSCSASAGGGDHPRSRGVYRPWPPPSCRARGSSPLARGLRVGVVDGADEPRIIPARAGFTSCDIFTRRIVRGSSPLARGLPVQYGTVFTTPGIIPARAGFTGPHRPGGGAPADHPRSRGVYRVKAARSRGGVGSSPLARGLPRGPPTPSPWARIIPARAGFTLPSPTEYLYLWDHPRSRGVYRISSIMHSTVSGSSPLARGLPGLDSPSRGEYRIIPARAGFTFPYTQPILTREDHPRSRGVYRDSYSHMHITPGSSPLARGLRPGDRGEGSVRGIIPARAGFTGR